MDHTAAVICVDYAPTGRELVTGSYDKTVRLYKAGETQISIFKLYHFNKVLISEEGHSREVYHTKRMQRLTCVAWTRDNK